MKYQLPEIIGTWSLTLGKADLKMRHEEFTLPKITFKDKEFRAAGMSGTINLPNGEKELGDISLPIFGKATDIIEAQHVCNVDGATLVMTGNNKRGGCGKTSSKTTIIIKGRVAEFDLGQLKSGEDNKTTLTIKPVSISISEDKKEVYLIDLIDGSDNHINGEPV